MHGDGLGNALCRRMGPCIGAAFGGAWRQADGLARAQAGQLSVHGTEHAKLKLAVFALGDIDPALTRPHSTKTTGGVPHPSCTCPSLSVGGRAIR